MRVLDFVGSTKSRNLILAFEYLIKKRIKIFNL